MKTFAYLLLPQSFSQPPHLLLSRQEGGHAPLFHYHQHHAVAFSIQQDLRKRDVVQEELLFHLPGARLQNFGRSLLPLVKIIVKITQLLSTYTFAERTGSINVNLKKMKTFSRKGTSPARAGETMIWLWPTNFAPPGWGPVGDSLKV